MYFAEKIIIISTSWSICADMLLCFLNWAKPPSIDLHTNQAPSSKCVCIINSNEKVFYIHCHTYLDLVRECPTLTCLATPNT